ncbi:MAG: hypothetical protein RL346_347 [Verrucomicrobiota bacterium]|jgi:riboflavin kinase/FMN adenylyltransferase
MICLDDLDDLPTLEDRLHLALGVFDGLHEGHQAVIREAVSLARTTGGLSLVVTFFPHPAEVLSSSPKPCPLIGTLNEKLMMLEAMGVDAVLVIEFDELFAAITAQDFILRLCRANVGSISIGEDWRFGFKREGNVHLLRSLGQAYGFTVKALPHTHWNGVRISSTRIRQAVQMGDFDAAEAMLGRHYTLSGIVVEGQQLGRTLGFPTANLRLPDIQLPPDGVWVVEVNGCHRGVANLGGRPTVDGSGERHFEVHLIDFSENLYGKTLQIRFLRYLRSIRAFDSLEALKAQICKDVQAARDFS